MALNANTDKKSRVEKKKMMLIFPGIYRYNISTEYIFSCRFYF